MSRAKSPNVLAVEPLSGQVLRIRWRDHGEDTVDLSREIATGRALASLRQPAVFATARVGEYGWTVAWDGDVELDATFLFRQARYQAAEALRPEEFRSWRAMHGLSQARAAEALGISGRMVKYYEDGSHMVPKTILLACKGYDALHADMAA
ncbi:MAG: DUF2442 domain-containing protein [Magnetospirillum sp. WYHS-4]